MSAASPKKSDGKNLVIKLKIGVVVVVVVVVVVAVVVPVAVFGMPFPRESPQPSSPSNAMGKSLDSTLLLLKRKVLLALALFSMWGVGGWNKNPLLNDWVLGIGPHDPTNDLGLVMADWPVSLVVVVVVVAVVVA